MVAVVGATDPVGSSGDPAHDGPQASPGWRLLFLLIQGTKGEGARAVALLSAGHWTSLQPT
jgi:hypothetical protein